jgi:ribosomal protein L40E
MSFAFESTFPKMAVLGESSPVQMIFTYESCEQMIIFKDGSIMTRNWTLINDKEVLVAVFYRSMTCYNEGFWCYKGEIDSATYERNGKGEMLLVKDDMTDHYFGDFKCNFFHGQGLYLCADGRKYVGEFEADKMEGVGKFTFANGDSYEGSFVNGEVDTSLTGTFTFAATGDSVTGRPDGIMSLVVDLSEYDFTLQEAEPESQTLTRLGNKPEKRCSCYSSNFAHFEFVQDLKKRCHRCYTVNSATATKCKKCPNMILVEGECGQHPRL